MSTKSAIHLTWHDMNVSVSWFMTFFTVSVVLYAALWRSAQCLNGTTLINPCDGATAIWHTAAICRHYYYLLPPQKKIMKARQIRCCDFSTHISRRAISKPSFTIELVQLKLLMTGFLRESRTTRQIAAAPPRSLALYTSWYFPFLIISCMASLSELWTYRRQWVYWTWPWHLHLFLGLAKFGERRWTAEGTQIDSE